MHQLSAAVGQGQPNRPPDVREAQWALNRSLALLGAMAPAMVDGRLGPRTAGLIRRYQQRVAGLETPGVIAPNGVTWKSLQGGVRAVASASAAAEMWAPSPIPTMLKAGDRKGLISAQWLHACRVRHAEGWAALLSKACARHEINTAERIAQFLANILVETSGLSRLVESLDHKPEALRTLWPARFSADLAMQLGRGAAHPANQHAIAERAYGGRRGNRPEGAGDGWLYRGRGCIQLTSRENYAASAAAIEVPLTQLIPRLETPEGAAESAAHFWRVNGCNALADTIDIRAVRRKVNGGENGLQDVHECYARLCSLIKPGV